MKIKINKKILYSFGILLALFCLLAVWQIFVPRSFLSNHSITYTAKNGQGDEDIARDLEKQGIIKSNYFFRFYVVFSLQHGKLQAGKYLLSPNMSVYRIVQNMVAGNVIKKKITILEGWDLADIKEYFEKEGVLKKEEFEEAIKQDYAGRFEFLKDAPGLEGYLFPDTYEVYEGESGDEILKNILANFNNKITPNLLEEITSQKKSLFQIITVASMIEKEVKTENDKKIVSGIIWKRLKTGMPLQIDATINYITGKSDPGALIKDTKIDSPYNTYKYTGLPKGPISNPGIESILAAIYPKDSPYWFYRSNEAGKIFFSETLLKHNSVRTFLTY